MYVSSKKRKDLEQGPPENATSTLSEGEIMALEFTACRNLANKLLRKQSLQHRPSSPTPELDMRSLDLHLKQRFVLLLSSFVSTGRGSTAAAVSDLLDGGKSCSIVFSSC